MRDIVVYTVAFNEETLMPYFLRWYSTFASRIVVYDNGSTDNTCAIVGNCVKAELRHLDTGGKMSDAANVEIKRSALHECRDSDWVFVVDVDELVFHPNMLGFLDRCKSQGITCIRPTGYDMVSDVPPDKHRQLFEVIGRGVQSERYSKPCIFLPGDIDDVMFGLGSHTAQATGNVRWLDSSEIKLLHYHQLGINYLIGRYSGRRSRVPEDYGSWRVDVDKIARVHDHFTKEARELVHNTVSIVNFGGAMPGEDTTGVGSVSGDPWITTIGGITYKFLGTPGKSYWFLNNTMLSVQGRMKGSSASVSYVDSITIKILGHTAQVGLDTILIDGKPVTAHHRQPGDWCWVQPQYGLPDRLIAVGTAGWLVSVFIDPGTDPMHKGGPLEGVNHIAVFADPPTVWLGSSGLVIDGSANCDPKLYEVTALPV